jgi:hypothetical protein
LQGPHTNSIKEGVMKTRRATTTLGVFVLACGVVLGWSVLAGGDFYVIPVAKKPANPALVPKTGQIECYESAPDFEACACGEEDCPPGQDGGLEKGANWPTPRFTDNGNGTVTDDLTGLIWAKDADCAGTMNWGAAVASCNALATGACGLSDGSSAGDWRLPNVRELQSLIHYGYYGPALPDREGTGRAKPKIDNPFIRQRMDWYWSSSSYAGGTESAWVVNFQDGAVNHGFGKPNTYYVRCVR